MLDALAPLQRWDGSQAAAPHCSGRRAVKLSSFDSYTRTALQSLVLFFSHPVALLAGSAQFDGSPSHVFARLIFIRDSWISLWHICD